MPARLYFTRSMRSRRIRSLYASTELWAWVLARRWYTPDKVDAFACSMSYLQQELYPAGYKGPVKPPASIRGYDINVMGMYGVSTVCGHFQRDDLMVKAAKCINKNVANACAKAPRTQGQPFRVCDGSAKLSNSNAQMNFCGNVHRFDDVDTWECGSGTPYTTKDVPMFPNPNEWNDEEPKTNETLFAQYFVFSGSGADPCAAELKARKDVATRAVLNGAHCRAHDAFGFQRTPTMVRALEYLPGYAGPNDIFGEYDPVLDFQMTDRPSGDSNGPYGPHRAPVFDRANFWDGSSAADLSASAIFGVELPAFEIDASPVSWARFAEFVQDGGYDDRRWWDDAGWRWLEQVGRRSPRAVAHWRGGVTVERHGQLRRCAVDEAAVHVTWHEAMAWCAWADRRLPTEAEWTLAATRGVGLGFAWGEVLE